jgi:hypothetical protein
MSSTTLIWCWIPWTPSLVLGFWSLHLNQSVREKVIPLRGTESRVPGAFPSPVPPPLVFPHTPNARVRFSLAKNRSAAPLRSTACQAQLLYGVGSLGRLHLSSVFGPSISINLCERKSYLCAGLRVVCLALFRRLCRLPLSSRTLPNSPNAPHTPAWIRINWHRCVLQCHLCFHQVPSCFSCTTGKRLWLP